MAKNHGNQIRDDAAYEELRKKGMSKEKAARIANAKANPGQHPSRMGGKGARYEERSKKALDDKAREVRIEGRSSMSKDELIQALRNH